MRRRRRLFNALAAASLLLLALSAAAAARGLHYHFFRHGRAGPLYVTAAARGRHLDIGPGGHYGGRLHLELITHWPGPAELAVGRGDFTRLELLPRNWNSDDDAGGSFLGLVWWSEAYRLPGAPAGPMAAVSRLPDPNSPVMPCYLLSIPLWMPAPPLTIPPAMRLLRWRKARRLARRGLCSRCGYDLLASKDRCPECGRAVAEAPVTSAAPAGRP